MIKLLHYIINYLVLLFNKKNIKVAFFSRIDNDTNLEGNNRIGRFCGLFRSTIGLATFMGNECEFSNTEIGKFCSIARNVKTIQGSHPTSKFVSTHPAFYSTLNQAGFHFAKQTYFEEYKKLSNGYSIKIGNDVWIGNDVRIMEGVQIGDGAIIGACTLVTKDIPPYAIVGGVPSHIIRFRFEEKIINDLIQIKWWNWSLSDLQKKANQFTDASDFSKTEIPI